MNRKLNQILWGGDKPGRAAVLGVRHVFAIVLSLFGKVSGILNSIPAAVMGGVSFILFVFVSRKTPS